MERISTFAERIKRYREVSDMTLAEMSVKVGLPAQTLNRYELAQRMPKVDTANYIADRLGINALWLQGYDVHMYSSGSYIPPGFFPLPETERVPLIGQIACGQPILAEENIEEYIDVPKGRHVDFCLICRGDSMIGAGISDGDIVFVRQQPDVENGEIAAVRIGDEATLKRVYKADNYITLSPDNPVFTPITVLADNLDGVCIVGKAVGFQHWL